MHLLLERGAARPDSVGAGGVRHGRFSPSFQQSGAVHPAGICASRMGCGQRTWCAPKNFFQLVSGPSTELILGPSQSIVLHQMRWNSPASKMMAPYPNFFAKCWMSPPRRGITLSVSFAILLGHAIHAHTAASVLILTIGSGPTRWLLRHPGATARPSGSIVFCRDFVCSSSRCEVQCDLVRFGLLGQWIWISSCIEDSTG